MRGEAVVGGPHAFVAGLAGRARERCGVAADELPDEPVARFEPDFGGVVDDRSVLERFEHFGEEPFEADGAAVAFEQRLVALAGDGVDAVGLGDRAVVLPQLGPGERPLGVFRHEAERRAVGERREHRAAGEVDADADDFVGRDAGGLECFAHCLGGAVEPIVRMLQRVVRRQFFLGGGREGIDDLAVRIGHDGGRAFVAREIDQERADRFGAEVDAERDFLCRRQGGSLRRNSLF